MIQIDRKEYPNPVLAQGRDDYSEEYTYSFLINTNDINVADNIEIPVSYELECPSLEKLLENNKLKALVKVKSSEASFCRIYVFDAVSRSMTIKIPKYDVIKKIEFTGCIVANEVMNKFGCSEMNQIYFKDITFDIRKGDILATDITKIIYIDDSELEKPIASIFTINKIADQDCDITTDFSDEKIQINMSVMLNQMYFALKDFNNGALRRYVIATVVYPVLIEAIDLIKQHYAGEEQEDYSSKRWFRAIELKAAKHGITIENYLDSSTKLADILLGNITLDALKSFKDTLDQEMNNGETENLGGAD